MPTYVFSCDGGHVLEEFRQSIRKRNIRKRCPECGLFMRRDPMLERKSASKVTHIDQANEPISHLFTKDSYRGAWVENLTPKPVFVETKAQYQNLLRKTHSREVDR